MVGAALVGVALTVAVAPSHAASATVDVSVNADEGLGTVPGTAYGANQAVWDTNMNTSASVSLLGKLGVGMMRYPGGSYGDGFHWQTNTMDAGGYVAPGTDFDSFMGTVKAAGSQAILIANYGTGTPQEAADWVRYANVTKGYHDQYWEIGNELYGNGYYGADWELDNHASKSPTTYATNVVQYAQAMKAVDPTIKVGAVLTLPGNWPDGAVASGDSKDWNQTVLPIVAPYVDFVIVHYYPSATKAADVLQGTNVLPGELAQLRQEINSYGGQYGPNIGVALTETNSNADVDTQPGALYNADTFATALENGVFTVDYWDTRNGMGTVSTAPDGATDYGDGGMLSSGGCDSSGTVCEPPLNTPFPSYYGLQMLGKYARPGDTLVKAGSDNQLLAVHAARNANGDLSVELVNKDPNNAYTVNLGYSGWSPSADTPTVYTYGDEATSITTSHQGSANTQVVPAYSIVTLTLTPAANNPVDTALTAPGSPTVGAVTSDGATISWQPSTGATVSRYEVYEQLGTNSVLLGESTSTSFTAHNLTPGTSYTLNVLAEGHDGYLSPPSTPVTFITGTPANSSCAVTYYLSTDWGSGFVANIAITDTGPAPITGWTLAFSFPSTTESVASGWNANYAENGKNVVVTPVNWDANLAANAGNTVSIGFTGSQAGADPSPASFTLNGTVCTTTYSS